MNSNSLNNGKLNVLTSGEDLITKKVLCVKEVGVKTCLPIFIRLNLDTNSTCAYLKWLTINVCVKLVQMTYIITVEGKYFVCRGL